MKVYIADAFTTTLFSGNQAGVALVEDAFPTEETMRALAGELKHSETAFVRRTGEKSLEVRYFTPEAEVDLCGHATIALFTVLREEEGLPPGAYTLTTKAGPLSVDVEEDRVWMDMAPARLVRTFTDAEALELYDALGLPPQGIAKALPPCVATTGLEDILLPADSVDILNNAVLNAGALTELSRRHGVVGAHLYTPGEGDITAHCRNFAPLYAIPEEAATGTANGALTFYLWQQGRLAPGAENTFLQGQAMGKPSRVYSRLTQGEDAPRIRIGGAAVTSLRGEVSL